MGALLGVPFINTHSVPPGRYHLRATCDDDGARWTADQDLVVSDDPTGSVVIELTQVR
jgi:hypothetical protein